MTRLNVNINDATATALRELAQARGTTVTETVRRAVSVLKFAEDAQADGSRIQVVSKRGDVTEVWLP